MTHQEIKPAATLILMRDFQNEPKVLMGQRGAKAAFMPNKFVFPGGRVDPGDHNIQLAKPLSDLCFERLKDGSIDTTPDGLAACAIRELWEETGQVLGQKADWIDPPKDWVDFARQGYRPDPTGMHFFFRAVTPPGRTRRFDARFFIINAEALKSDPDDFSSASDELSHLSWVPLSEARSLNLPFITSVVLGEVEGLDRIGPPPSIPFFNNGDEESLFERIGL